MPCAEDMYYAHCRCLARFFGWHLKCDSATEVCELQARKQYMDISAYGTSYFGTESLLWKYGDCWIHWKYFEIIYNHYPFVQCLGVLLPFPDLGHPWTKRLDLHQQ